MALVTGQGATPCVHNTREQFGYATLCTRINGRSSRRPLLPSFHGLLYIYVSPCSTMDGELTLFLWFYALNFCTQQNNIIYAYLGFCKKRTRRSWATRETPGQKCSPSLIGCLYNVTVGYIHHLRDENSSQITFREPSRAWCNPVVRRSAPTSAEGRVGLRRKHLSFWRLQTCAGWPSPSMLVYSYNVHLHPYYNALPFYFWKKFIAALSRNY